jgi:hypothetical protein
MAVAPKLSEEIASLTEIPHRLGLSLHARQGAINTTWMF